MKTCNNSGCTAYNQEVAVGRFCPDCGQALAEKDSPLPHCSNSACPNARPLIELKSKFCPECGGAIIVPSSAGAMSQAMPILGANSGLGAAGESGFNEFEGGV